MELGNRTIVDTFEIPDETAKELSNLLIKQKIRKDLLFECVNDKDKYNEVENMLIPIEAKIEAFKQKITNNYVPKMYATDKFLWIYDGYELAENKCYIIYA